MSATEKKSLKSVLRILIPFVLIPFAVALGIIVFDGKKNIFVSLSIAFLSLILFFTGLEKKKLGTRRAVIVSAMIALSVIGRFIPFFKPVTALTIITAAYLGSESGFLVGSLSALISNFYFGQGPWTPFQMLAWGLIGYFAGCFSKLLQKSRALLLIYGVISGAFFSLIMDAWMVMWYEGGLELKLYSSALIAAIPHTLLYAVSNFVFLFFMAKPFGDKLSRIKIKYGI